MLLFHTLTVHVAVVHHYCCCYSYFILLLFMSCYVHAVVFLQLMLTQLFYAAVAHAVLLHDAVAQAACVPFLTLLTLLRHLQSFAV
jgi:hypothetical protein